MTSEPTPLPSVGLVRLRDHCTFKWCRDDGAAQRAIEILDHHCLQCIAEARRLEYKLLSADGKDYPP